MSLCHTATPGPAPSLPQPYPLPTQLLLRAQQLGHWFSHTHRTQAATANERTACRTAMHLRRNLRIKGEYIHKSEEKATGDGVFTFIQLAESPPDSRAESGKCVQQQLHPFSFFPPPRLKIKNATPCLCPRGVNSSLLLLCDAVGCRGETSFFFLPCVSYLVDTV